MSKSIKKISILLMLICIILSCMVVPANAALPDNDIVSPMSSYLKTGLITITKSSGYAVVEITTIAFASVANIYHDVSIFVNGVKYTSGSRRYSKTNSNNLKTSISVPASSGDYIDVYADHYTSHNNITEVKHSNVNYTY